MATKTENPKFPYLFYFIAFIEGACVMITELLGAKIIAPFYGASLYVWSSVLGVTLFSLATGYYLGGIISTKTKKIQYLAFIFFGAALFTSASPFIAPFFMEQTLGLGIRYGSLISVLVYLSPPIIFMGMVSPIITQYLTKDSINAGHSAGKVYAVSTLGGIISTLAAGFYIIPELGITKTALFTGILLLICSIGIALIHKSKLKAISLSAIFLALIFGFYSNSSDKKSTDAILKYQSTGVLGQWTVIDKLAAIDQGDRLYTRQLLLNGVDQTYTQVGNEPVSMWFYPHKISALAGTKPPESKALLLGMGGGSIAHNLFLLDFDVDIVELDQRIPYIAKNWFGYNPASSNLIIDDARHFIRMTDKKYDLIIMDMVSGEVQPSHFFTKESLQDLRANLKDDALVILNFQGRIDQQNPLSSLGPLSVMKTFLSAGYDMAIAKQNTEESPSLSDDMLIYGSPNKLNLERLLENKYRYNDIFPFTTFSSQDFAPQSDVSLDKAQIFTDDKQNLEIVNAPTILVWRKNKIKFTVNEMLGNNLPLYK